MLKQAIDLGLTDVASAGRDEDLAILRGRPDFQKLISGGKH